MIFQFPEVTECKLTNVNVRREFHGEERVPAFDLSFSKEGSNDLLDLIDPALRPTIYFNAAADNGQAALPNVLAILPNLRVPKLCSGKFTYAKKEKWKGYRFVLDYGLGDELSNIDIGDCTLRITGLTDEAVFIQLIPSSNLQLINGKATGWKPANPDADGDGDDDTDADADQDEEPDAGALFAAQHGGAADDSQQQDEQQ